jgi:carbohydrate ABC transporter ATP-binding protein, CUT1 family (TC 3.A.1.1.-)
MARVRLEDTVKNFDSPSGTIVAVDNIDLEIEEGEFLVIVGPSGSGKSTTLRMIAGLETPSEGTITIGGDDVTNVSPQNRDIAMVFQNYALYPHRTVEGNMSYGLRKSSELTGSKIKERVHEFAEMMGIDDTLQKKPDQLSGGQKQRVALGRAIVQDPGVFLMDEPLSNLDAKLKIQMRTEFQRLHNELENTTIYVTHDQQEAMTMADRIVVMHDGMIQQMDVPGEIYDRPVNEFVARFIGEPTMNFADVNITNGRISGADFRFKIDDATANLDDGEYRLGIRPEDIVLEDTTMASGEAEVVVTEPTGSDAVVYLQGENEYSVVTSRQDLPEIGSVIPFRIPGEKIHLFDANSKKTVYHGPAKQQGFKAEITGDALQ